MGVRLPKIRSSIRLILVAARVLVVKARRGLFSDPPVVAHWARCRRKCEKSVIAPVTFFHGWNSSFPHPTFFRQLDLKRVSSITQVFAARDKYSGRSAAPRVRAECLQGAWLAPDDKEEEKSRHKHVNHLEPHPALLGHLEASMFFRLRPRHAAPGNTLRPARVRQEEVHAAEVVFVGGNGRASSDNRFVNRQGSVRVQRCVLMLLLA